MNNKMWNKIMTILSEVLESELDSKQVQEVSDAFEKRKSEISKLFSSGVTKRKKDPNAPKKWKTSYIMFCMENRDKLKNVNESMSATEITSQLGKMWKELNDKDKVRYQALSEKDKVRYQDQVKEYVPSENSSFPETGKKKRTLKNKREDTGPKRPLSSYMYFCQSEREVIKKDHPNMGGKEVTTELGKRWKLLTPDQKTPFEKKQKQDKERYENEKLNGISEPTITASKSKVTRKVIESETATPSKKTENKTVEKPSSKKTENKTVEKPSSKKTENKTVEKPSSKKTPGYEYYIQETQETLMEEHEDWDERKILSEISKMWKDLSEDEQNDYEMVASVDDEQDDDIDLSETNSDDE